jgi:hypothetical protein
MLQNQTQTRRAMTQLRVGETHTPSEEGEGRADFRGLAMHAT